MPRKKIQVDPDASTNSVPESSRGRGPAKTEEERQERLRAARRRYRETHPEQVRETIRNWKAKNPDKVKESRAQHRERNLDRLRAENRDRERDRAAKARAEKDRREAARQRARDWYAQNTERHLDYQRQYRAKQKAEDPDAYREAKRLRNKRWHDTHREAENAKLRQKYRDNPEFKQQKAAAAARYYAKNPELMKERRHAYYAKNKEKQLEKQREWRAREKRRKEAGLPPRRLHRVGKSDREGNALAAAMFFSKTYTPDQVAAMRVQLRTPPELLAIFKRDQARVRAAFRFATSPSSQAAAEAARLVALARQREVERLEAIGRAVNEQLRLGSRPPTQAMQSTAPSTAVPAPTRGMTR